MPTNEKRHSVVPEPHREPKRSIAIKNFSPLWFTISMDTGILSIILRLLPYHFSGQNTLFTILFVFNLVLFTTFTLLSLARLARFPHHVRAQTLTDVEELSYLGAPPTAYLTLVAQVVLTCSQSWGYAWTLVAYVLWWLGLVWSLSLTAFSVVLLAKRNLATPTAFSPPMFLPLISAMTLGTTGALLATYGDGISADMAVPVIVVSYMVLGFAFFLALVYYALLAQTLFAAGLPPPGKLPALMIAVGPLGQFATAIQGLSAAASQRGLFARYDEGVWLTGGAAASVSASAVLLALPVLGFAFLWITVTWYVVLEAGVRRTLAFGLSWWSLIFPMGVFTTALLNLSIALDSPAFRGLTAALLVFLFVVYFVNWAGTLWRIWQGVALGIPQQREDEDQQAKDKKERMDRYVVRNGDGNGRGENV